MASPATLPAPPASGTPTNVGPSGPSGPRPAGVRALDRPAGTTSQIAWRYAGAIIVMHVLALLAFVPWLFSWTGVVALVVGVYFYGAFGINLGYHRLLTHRSFTVPRWLERSFTTVAICCMEDTPAAWVAAHRMHHRDSDEQPDPHTPLVSFLWSHMGWLMVENHDVRGLNACDRYARDILKDPYYRWLQRGENALLVYIAHAVLYFSGGFVGGWAASGGDAWAGLQLGASLVVWGVYLRTVAVWHITWTVNSLSHLFGYRTYTTDEESRNNWFVALITSGEGWHNNHHADPASASNWHRWWEIDLMWLIVLGLERVGLAWDVKRPRSHRQAAAG